MNIMGDSQKVLGIRRSVINLVVEVIHGINDGGWGVIVVIIGVHVKVDNVIAQRVHRANAVASARGVWRAHVCRELPNDVAEGSLVVVHLGSAGVFSDCGEIWVGPTVGLLTIVFIRLALKRARWVDLRMRGNLMAFVLHTFN